MEPDDKHLLRHKLDYLKLALKISRLRYHGKEPSIELLKAAYKLGRLAGISKEELKNLWFKLNLNNQGRYMIKFLITALTFLLFFVAYVSSEPF